MVLAVSVLLTATLVAYLAWHTHSLLLRVSTTTSLYDTGLLDKLARRFHVLHPDIVVQFIPVGSGQALRLAADGSVCLVLVHAPNLEKLYIERSVLTHHVIFAYNYFVLVGPKDDPAGVRNATSIFDAFRRIAEAGAHGRALFVSRGDCSGTYVRERLIWEMVGLDPRPGKDPWYVETGSGMAATLRIASEKHAYTLSDIGTFAKLSANGAIPGLTILYPSKHIDSILVNVYSAYLVGSCKGAERKAAELFINFLVSRDAQQLIARYKVGDIALFYPALKSDINLTKVWDTLASYPTPPECR